MAEVLRILALEPYFGGPHREFLEGLRSRSRHEWTLLAMPARRWRWRMRGAAVHLAREAATLGRRRFDLVFASEFLSVAEFKALAPPAVGRLPAVTYFHENQLSYPVEPGQRRDPQYGFLHLTTWLASAEAWFNSAFHRDALLAALRGLLGRMPDYVPEGLVDGLAARSRVLAPGADLAPLRTGRERADRRPPLTVLWNHRWEFDKNPETFFEVLFYLAEEGAAFRLAVVGEAIRKWPPVFEEAKRRLADRLIRFGYLPDRREYEALLCRADVVVSTAFHEFFGLPVVEAVAAGCFPLVPARLSYPEIVPPELQPTFFYKDARDLRVKLQALLAGKGPWDKAARLAAHVQRYDWGRMARAYDDALVRAAEGAAPS